MNSGTVAERHKIDAKIAHKPELERSVSFRRFVVENDQLGNWVENTHAA